MADLQVLTARWVFPVTAPPLEQGVVTIAGDRIVAVEPHGSRKADVDLGNMAIIPGLVNAHTHLDLSGLRDRVPPGPDFIGWLRAIITHRRSQTLDQIAADIETGLADALRFGTTMIGDIAAEGRSWPFFAKASCWSVVFREMLGLSNNRVIPAWKEASGWLEDHPDSETCRAGLSPHAPYSVHQSLFRAAGHAWAPLSIHLGESLEETMLLDEHRGPFVDFLRELGVWNADGLAPSHDWIVWRSEPAPALLLAHGNHLPLEMSLPANSTIVYCPRTHAAFGRPRHPFAEFISRGVRVALGTDSLASNPNLDILAEARFLHVARPEIPGETLLRMATLSGAEAMGLGHLAGSLEAGKTADLVSIPLSKWGGRDPYALLLASNEDDQGARRTMWRGIWR
ncbi:MAG: amidohydrolase family protein [Planctomycetes bacterium]|nr:amidohydrolase family protein [Planctomycetota bacterium]